MNTTCLHLVAAPASLVTALALGCGSSQAPAQEAPPTHQAPALEAPVTTTAEAANTEQGAMNPAEARIEAELRSVAAGTATGTDFTFVYDDMHGLYGGETITVHGDGTLQAVWQLQPGDPRAEHAGTVSPASLRDLATLLVAQRAWRHETPARTYLPDTTFAHVRLRFGAESTDAWEVHGQPRLGEIKRAMEALVPALANRVP